MYSSPPMTDVIISPNMIDVIIDDLLSLTGTNVKYLNRPETARI
jgi:hypothetical protein